jgi:small subunit ribosomal protein S2
MIGAKSICGRFTPGTLTNPKNEGFIEPSLVFTADPPVDRQVIKEAVATRLPVISLCDTSNLLKNIDFAIPANNKGKKALALIYWLICREVLKERGTIKSNEEFTALIDDFESKAEREEKPGEEEAAPRFRRFGWSKFGGGDRRPGGGGFQRGPRRF